MSELFDKKLAALGITLSEKQKKQFDTYYEMLVAWNEKMNLTGITAYEEVNEKHFVDSLAGSVAFDLEHTAHLIDVGTGAGFPGIPLKILCPHVHVTLLDSLNKRLKFLDAVIAELDLEGIETIHGRAEDFGRDKAYREQYDVCVSRAVANLATLSEYCLPFVKTGGCFVSYKSGEIDEELKKADKAIKELGGQVKNVHKGYLPGSDIGRSLVCIEKIKNTKKKYPRKAGTPQKSPLFQG